MVCLDCLCLSSAIKMSSFIPFLSAIGSAAAVQWRHNSAVGGWRGKDNLRLRQITLRLSAGGGDIALSCVMLWILSK